MKEKALNPNGSLSYSIPLSFTTKVSAVEMSDEELKLKYSKF